MSTVLNESTARTATSPAQRLRRTMAAVRVSVRWFGIRRSLSAEQKAEAAEPFGAEAKFLSAGKKLLDNTGGPPPGNGTLFGLVFDPWVGVVFVDDGSNTLNLLH